MKRLYILLIIFSASVFFSCEDFLEVEHEGKPTEEQFYNNVNDIQRSLAAVYNLVQDDNFLKCEWLFGEGCGDDVVTESQSPVTEEEKLMTFTFTKENSWILKRWQFNYEGIFRANYVITHAPAVYLELLDYMETLDEGAASGFIQTLRKIREFYAQAKFLRAYFYFNLVKTYGGVPIQPEKLTIDGNKHNFIQPRATKEEVYKYIEKDLREATLGLVTDYGVSMTEFQGMVTRSAAFGYLIKVLAYQADHGVNHENWQEIVDICDHFVEGNDLSYAEILKIDDLYPNETWEEIQERLLLQPKRDSVVSSGSNFIRKGHELIDYYDAIQLESKEFSDESIFEINFAEYNDDKDANTNVSTKVWSQVIKQGGGGKLFAPSSLAAEKYNDGDKPRWRFSIAAGSLQLETGKVTFWTLPTLSAVFKYWSLPSEQPIQWDKSGRNVRLMRYAEVLLFYAEALNETGNQTGAMAIVNSLRERANNMVDANYTNDKPWLSQRFSALKLDMYSVRPYDYTRDVIWEERHSELCFEWDRFWDLVRQGNISEKIKAFNEAEQNHGFKKFTSGLNEVFPIPQEEIRLSNGVLLQNPGY